MILVRHGETTGESSIRYHGRGDVALSELGRAQMRAACTAIERLDGGMKFARVFSSPLSRASEGARIVAGESAEIFAIEEFAEVHFGLFEGLTAEEIRERYPREFARFSTDRLSADYAYPGGESRADFTRRVRRGVAKMLELWPHDSTCAGTAVVVAHRGTIRQIVEYLAGERPIVELGSIQIMRFDGKWRTVALDVTEHLIK
ncbi:MAG TPA: histidine phosphatase family protein [Candidatus Binataceae bacterium]|nr:histidine phosphatase family protein [Candidatus Binataceae bacterium]